MKQLKAFMRKEFLEQLRTGRLLILVLLFSLFGIMNPTIAKLTPWLMEQIAKNGMMITGMEINALTSWTQFFKNSSVILIIFLVMFCSILTAEYQKGTLIPVITKGINRWKVLCAKLAVMTSVWTIGYFLSFGITFGCNSCFWDNSIAQNLGFAVFGYYLTGFWLITLILFASSVFNFAPCVLFFAGTAYAVSCLLSLLPALRQYMPTFLMHSNELMSKTTGSEQFLTAVVITVFLCALHVILAVLFFNRKAI